MVSEIRVYFEGHAALRSGFRKFLSPVSPAACPGPAVKPIAGGSRDQALKLFIRGLKRHPNALNLLLVDAEGPVTSADPWGHLQDLGATKLLRPDGAHHDSAHLMVQVMESWFLADPQALESYYGRGFAGKRLPKRDSLEGIPKAEVLRALRKAATGTRKRIYHKTAHAPELLEKIDPAKVRAASPWCERLFKTIEAVIESA